MPPFRYAFSLSPKRCRLITVPTPPPTPLLSLLMDDKNMHAYNSCLFSLRGGGGPGSVLCVAFEAPWGGGGDNFSTDTHPPPPVESIIYCIKNPLVIFETCGRHLSFSLSFSIYILTSIKPTTEPNLLVPPLLAWRHFVTTSCISVEWARWGENERPIESVLDAGKTWGKRWEGSRQEGNLLSVRLKIKKNKEEEGE